MPPEPHQPLLGVPFVVLRHIGLDDAELNVGIRNGRRDREAQRTQGQDGAGEQHRHRHRRAPLDRAGHEQGCGQAGRGDREQAQPVGAGEGHRLERRVADRPDRGDRVPGELQAESAAQGLGQGPGDGEGQRLRRRRSPAAQGHQSGGEAHRERQEEGQAQHGRDGVDAEPLGVGEEGDPDPIESGQEEAEAEGGAADEGPARARPGAGSRSGRQNPPRPAEGRAAAALPPSPGRRGTRRAWDSVRARLACGAGRAGWNVGVSRPAAGDGCARA